MIGYYKMPDKMAEEMTDDGYFKTGDRGEIDEKVVYALQVVLKSCLRPVRVNMLHQYRLKTNSKPSKSGSGVCDRCR